jgi:hypothetical protein
LWDQSHSTLDGAGEKAIGQGIGAAAAPRAATGTANSPAEAIVPAAATLPAEVARRRPFAALGAHEVETGVWYPLLDREPRKLIWPGSNNSNHVLDPDQGRMWVTCDGTGLFALGSTDADDFTYRIDIHQNQWEGGVGIFFGYREDVFDGKPCGRFQRLLLTREKGPDSALQKRAFKISRSLETAQLNSAANREMTTTLSEAVLKFPSIDPQTLEIVVRDGILSRVAWGGAEVPELIDPRPEEEAGFRNIRGSFGTFHRQSGAMVFRAAIRIDDPDGEACPKKDQSDDE